jgi:hypothetical protein
MITYDEVKDELETFEHDYPDDDERRGIIIDYILQIQDEPRRKQCVEQLYKPASEVEFTIKVHEAMACAVSEVPTKFLPEGNLERLVLKMAPRVANWLLEDFNVSEKE